jgi:lipopolysaccharide transport system permease protein
MSYAEQLEDIHHHIAPPRKLTVLNLKELWEYRELLSFLVWRDILIRYKQTALGASWAILQPFLTMVVFSVVFTRLTQVPTTNDIPYPLLSFSALVPWTFFANGLSMASNSLVASQNLIKKVYFPRLLIPVATIASGLLDFLLSFLVLLLMMVFYKIHPTINIIYLPFFLLLAFVSSLGIGLWFSALNVEYRDVRYAIPFLIQLGLFASPVAYSSNLLSEPWRSLYGINPMAGVIEGFRWALLGDASPPSSVILISTVAAFVVLVSGILYFKRMEASFADIV